MKHLIICCLSLWLWAGLSHANNIPLAGLTFEGGDGEQHRLGEYIGKGRWVFLNVWAIRCPICVAEMPDLQKLHTNLADKVEVLGFVVDFPSLEYPDRAETNAFMQQRGLTFDNLLGDADTFLHFRAGKLVGTPTMLVFTPEGRLLAKQVGQLSYQSLVDFVHAQESVRSKK